MEILSDSETYQMYALQVFSLIKSLVQDEGARLLILEETFNRYEDRNRQVKFADEKTLAIFLRLTARQLCSNFLQVTCKK